MSAIIFLPCHDIREYLLVMFLIDDTKLLCLLSKQGILQICDQHRFFTHPKENTETDVFLSHKQSTGQGIALSLRTTITPLERSD